MIRARALANNVKQPLAATDLASSRSGCYTPAQRTVPVAGARSFTQPPAIHYGARARERRRAASLVLAVRERTLLIL
jgi:hypothetical protein